SGFRSELGRRVERLLRLREGESPRPAGWRHSLLVCSLPAVVTALIIFVVARLMPGVVAQGLDPRLFSQAWRSSLATLAHAIADGREAGLTIPVARAFSSVSAAPSTADTPSPEPSPATPDVPSVSPPKTAVLILVKDGNLLADLGKVDEAMDKFEEALDLDPINVEAAVALARVERVIFGSAEGIKVLAEHRQKMAERERAKGYVVVSVALEEDGARRENVQRVFAEPMVQQRLEEMHARLVFTEFPRPKGQFRTERATMAQDIGVSLQYPDNRFGVARVEVGFTAPQLLRALDEASIMANHAVGIRGKATQPTTKGPAVGLRPPVPAPAIASAEGPVSELPPTVDTGELAPHPPSPNSPVPVGFGLGPAITGADPLAPPARPPTPVAPNGGATGFVPATANALSETAPAGQPWPEAQPAKAGARRAKNANRAGGGTATISAGTTPSVAVNTAPSATPALAPTPVRASTSAEDTTTEPGKKVPGLGDIPVLGRLFQVAPGPEASSRTITATRISTQTGGDATGAAPVPEPPDTVEVNAGAVEESGLSTGSARIGTAGGRTFGGYAGATAEPGQGEASTMPAPVPGAGNRRGQAGATARNAGQSATVGTTSGFGQGGAGSGGFGGQGAFTTGAAGMGNGFYAPSSRPGKSTAPEAVQAKLKQLIVENVSINGTSLNEVAAYLREQSVVHD
ncbi:MAG TPA: hypothetical protein VHH73_11015, partial [Verrucomicrobiae bacterium]|nr:hypothetical protein [Verrucomicrobiae bacterium]